MREWREQNTFLFFFNFFSFVDLNLKEENYNEPTKMHTKTYSELYETRSKVDVFQSMAFYRFFFCVSWLCCCFVSFCMPSYLFLFNSKLHFFSNKSRMRFIFLLFFLQAIYTNRRLLMRLTLLFILTKLFLFLVLSYSNAKWQVRCARGFWLKAMVFDEFVWYISRNILTHILLKFHTIITSNFF